MTSHISGGPHNIPVKDGIPFIMSRGPQQQGPRKVQETGNRSQRRLGLGRECELELWGLWILVPRTNHFHNLCFLPGCCTWLLVFIILCFFAVNNGYILTVLVCPSEIRRGRCLLLHSSCRHESRQRCFICPMPARNFCSARTCSSDDLLLIHQCLR